MQISIEKENCMGCGLCEQKCSDIFKLGEDGKAQVLKEDCCGTCCECDLEEISKGCPAGAIEIN